MKLGIFDSGRGGELVAEKLKVVLPDHEYVIINDIEHAPYGERSYEDIRALTDIAIQKLLNCDIIVIACNSATAAAIDYLRTHYPKHLFVGFEPMIKPAAELTSSQHITLLATKATSYSARTELLIKEYAPNVRIDRPDTYGWATSIDHDKADQISFRQLGESISSGSDTIIIGCTHYIALIPRLKKEFPNVNVLEPTDAVARQITKLIAAR